MPGRLDTTLSLLRTLVDPSGDKLAGQRLPEETEDAAKAQPPPTTLEELLERKLASWKAQRETSGPHRDLNDAISTDLRDSTSHEGGSGAKGTGDVGPGHEQRVTFAFALACLDTLLELQSDLMEAMMSDVRQHVGNGADETPQQENAATGARILEQGQEAAPLVPLSAFTHLTTALECLVVWGICDNMPEGLGVPVERRGKEAKKMVGFSRIGDGPKTRYFRDEPKPLTQEQKDDCLRRVLKPLVDLVGADESLQESDKQRNQPGLMLSVSTELAHSYVSDLLSATCHLSLAQVGSDLFVRLIRHLPPQLLVPALLIGTAPLAPADYKNRMKSALTFAIFGKPDGVKTATTVLLKAMGAGNDDLSGAAPQQPAPNGQPKPDGAAPPRSGSGLAKALENVARVICIVPTAAAVQDLEAVGLSLWATKPADWRLSWLESVGRQALELVTDFAGDLSRSEMGLEKQRGDPNDPHDHAPRDDRLALAGAYLLCRLWSRYGTHFRTAVTDSTLERSLLRLLRIGLSTGARVEELGCWLSALELFCWTLDEGGSDPTPLNRSFVLSQLLGPVATLLFRLSVGLSSPSKPKISVADDSLASIKSHVERLSRTLMSRYVSELEKADGQDVAVKALEMFWEACYSDSGSGQVDVEVYRTEDSIGVGPKTVDETFGLRPTASNGEAKVGNVKLPGAETNDEESNLDASMKDLRLGDADSPSQVMLLRFVGLLKEWATTSTESEQTKPVLVAAFFGWVLDEWVKGSTMLRELTEGEEQEEDEELQLRQMRLSTLLMTLISVFSDLNSDEVPPALQALVGSVAHIVNFLRSVLLASDAQDSENTLASAALTLLASSLSSDPGALISIPRAKLEELNMLLSLKADDADDEIKPLFQAVITAIRSSIAFAQNMDGTSGSKSALDDDEDAADSPDLLARSLNDIRKPTSLAPLKARGLSTLTSLILSEDSKTLAMGTSGLVSIGLEALRDPEEFVYINAIKFLAAVTDHDPKGGIGAMVDEFTKERKEETEATLAERVKVGEVLLRAVLRRGEVLGAFGGSHIARRVPCLRSLIGLTRFDSDFVDSAAIHSGVFESLELVCFAGWQRQEQGQVDRLFGFSESCRSVVCTISSCSLFRYLFHGLLAVYRERGGRGARCSPNRTPTCPNPTSCRLSPRFICRRHLQHAGRCLGKPRQRANLVRSKVGCQSSISFDDCRVWIGCFGRSRDARGRYRSWTCSGCVGAA